MNAFWKGFGSILDIFPKITSPYPVDAPTDMWGLTQADRDALASDWSIVGQNLRAAIEKSLTICETSAAITTHLRFVTPEMPINYGGYSERDTLCGMGARWDTKAPISTVRCRACRQIAGLSP